MAVCSQRGTHSVLAVAVGKWFWASGLCKLIMQGFMQHLLCAGVPTLKQFLREQSAEWA